MSDNINSVLSAVFNGAAPVGMHETRKRKRASAANAKRAKKNNEVKAADAGHVVVPGHNMSVLVKQLIETRKEYVGAATRAYGASQAYASAINAQPDFDGAWYDDNAHKGAAGERATLKAAMLIADPSLSDNTFRQRWSNIKKAAKIAREGAPEAEANNNTARVPLVRFMDDLLALYKYGMGQDNLSEKLADCHELVGKALVVLGVNLDTVKVGKGK